MRTSYLWTVYAAAAITVYVSLPGLPAAMLAIGCTGFVIDTLRSN